jgi:hypothetical protein
MVRLVPRFPKFVTIAAPSLRTSESKGAPLTYGAGAAIDLKFLNEIGGLLHRNFKSAAPVESRVIKG